LIERKRILIIDDDRPVAAAIALELGAHDVVVAESGREALEILRHDKSFDVILCDLMMPEVSGMDVYESLRLVDPALLGRVVLMTGGAFTKRAGQFLAEVDAPMIEKPFHPGQLHAVVNALDQRREQIAEAPEPDEPPWRPYEPNLGKGKEI
jgi:DNA-binding NtrC family response regulator